MYSANTPGGLSGRVGATPTHHIRLFRQMKVNQMMKGASLWGVPSVALRRGCEHLLKCGEAIEQMLKKPVLRLPSRRVAGAGE